MVRVCLLSMYDSSAHCLHQQVHEVSWKHRSKWSIKFGKVTPLSPARSAPHVETNCKSLSLRENHPSQTLDYERAL